MTASLQEERKLVDHIKDIERVKLSYPSIRDSYAYIMQVFDEKNINYDQERLLHIVSKNNGNIRETILNLESSNEDIMCKEHETAFRDMNSFEIAKKILLKKHNKEDLNYLINSDCGTIPYILYENIPLEIDTNYKMQRGKTAKSLIDYYMNINDMFINASILEDFAFKNMNWSTISYATHIKLSSLHQTLESLDKKASVKDVPYKFSQMISKISHKNIMGKKLKGISISLHDISNTNLIIASDTKIQSKQDIEIKPNAKTNKKNSKDAQTEKLSIIKTYEKYFV
jgi:hypothetical protein